jgi:ubiquinone biosynthesis protein
MVVVEGVSRSLDPDFDMWSTSEPVVVEWVQRNLGPAGTLQEAVEAVAALSRLLASLPELTERTGRLASELGRIAENGIRLDAETIALYRRAEGAWSGRLALWIIATALALVAWRILAG